MRESAHTQDLPVERLGLFNFLVASVSESMHLGKLDFLKGFLSKSLYFE